jgi:hypothetical protein
MKRMMGTGVAGGQGEVQGLVGGFDHKRFDFIVQISMGELLRLRPLPMDARYGSNQLTPSRPLLCSSNIPNLHSACTCTSMSVMPCSTGALHHC